MIELVPWVLRLRGHMGQTQQTAQWNQAPGICSPSSARAFICITHWSCRLDKPEQGVLRLKKCLKTMVQNVINCSLETRSMFHVQRTRWFVSCIQLEGKDNIPFFSILYSSYHINPGAGCWLTKWLCLPSVFLLYINPGIKKIKALNQLILPPAVSKSFQIETPGQPTAQIREEKHHLCKGHWTLEKVRSTRRTMERPWEPLLRNNTLAWSKYYGPGTMLGTGVTKTKRVVFMSSRSLQSGGGTGTYTNRAELVLRWWLTA